MVAGGFLNGGQKVRVADAVDQRGIQARRALEQAGHAAIGPLHPAIGANGNDRILHAVEEGLEFALAGLHAGEAFLNLARGHVESGRHLADLIGGGGSDSGGEVARSDAFGKGHDTSQTPANILRGRGSDDEGDDKRSERAP
jgi:uncharacterized protein YgbK (DUF1537 family)